MSTLISYAILAGVFLDVYFSRFRPVQICTTDVLKIRYRIHIFIVYGLLAEMIILPRMLYFIVILLDVGECLLIQREIRSRGE